MIGLRAAKTRNSQEWAGMITPGLALGACGETHPGSSPGVRMIFDSNYLEH